jgi:hypothetical protein
MLELTARTLVELRLCLLRPHRRGGAAEELRPLPLPFGGGRPQGGEGAVRRRSSGQSRKGAQRVEQRCEGGCGLGAAVRGWARPANLQQGGTTLAAVAPGRALERGAAELLRQATDGGAVTSSPGGELCRLVFSLPLSSGRPELVLLRRLPLPRASLGG